MMAPECNVATTEQYYDQRPTRLASLRRRSANISSEIVTVEIITAAGRGYDNHCLEKGHCRYYGNILQAHPGSLHGVGYCPRFDVA